MAVAVTFCPPAAAFGALTAEVQAYYARCSREQRADLDAQKPAPRKRRDGRPKTKPPLNLTNLWRPDTENAATFGMWQVDGCEGLVLHFLTKRVAEAAAATNCGALHGCDPARHGVSKVTKTVNVEETYPVECKGLTPATASAVKDILDRLLKKLAR